MEYLPGMREGESPSVESWCLLQDWLCNEKKTTEADRVSMIETARSQLQKAHALQVKFRLGTSTAVHGDLRPCNVAVRQSGEKMEIRFLDFGFAGVAVAVAVADGTLEQAR